MDSLGDIATLVYTKIIREPVVRETDHSSGDTALIADLSIRGVWLAPTD